MGLLLSTVTQEEETRRLQEERRRFEEERRQQDERNRQQMIEEERRQQEERRRQQRIEEEEQRQLRKLKREVELKQLEYKHKEELEKIRDREVERKDKLADKKEQNQHERSMGALDLLKQNFEKVKEMDLNYSICTGQLIHSVANGTELDTEAFQTVANKVPAALPSTVSLTQLVKDVIQTVDESDCGID